MQFLGPLTDREIWTLFHGMGLGAVFLLAFGGGLAGLYSLREDLVTVEGVRERTRRLLAGTWIMAIVAWLTVLSGTFIAYPWYRATPPEGADLSDYPRSLLLSDEATSVWHEFGMEWKEHVAWIAPFLATAVAFAVAYYGIQLVKRRDIRRAAITLFILAFLAAGAAGMYGALITKAAPVA